MAEKSLRDGEHAHKEFPPPPYESIEHGKTAASLEVNEKSTGDRNKQSANKDKPSRGRLSRFTRWAFEPSAARQPAGNSSRADRRRAKDGVAVKPKAPVKSSVKPGFSAKAGKAANPPVVKPPASTCSKDLELSSDPGLESRSFAALALPSNPGPWSIRSKGRGLSSDPGPESTDFAALGLPSNPGLWSNPYLGPRLPSTRVVAIVNIVIQVGLSSKAGVMVLPTSTAVSGITGTSVVSID